MDVLSRGFPNISDDDITSTLDNIRDTLTEQWMAGNPITKEMLKQKNIKSETGGNSIVEDLEYQDSDTIDWVDQATTLSVSTTPVLTQAQFLWAVLSGTITIGDHDEAKNSGTHKKHDLLKVRMNNLKNTFIDQLERALLRSTTTSVREVWSLVDVVASGDPGIANYGNIDRDNAAWWQATQTASGSMATQGLEDMRTAYNTVSRALTDPVSLIVTTQTVYEAYSARLIPQERLAKVGDLEFDHLAFNSKPVFFSERMPSGVMLGLNMKYHKLTINSNMKFKNQPFTRVPGGQSRSAVVQTMLQLTSSRVGSSFKLTSMTA